MKIVISDTGKVEQLQEQFSAEFPYLKLEFFSRPHQVGHGTARGLMKTNAQTIGEYRTVKNKGHVNIKPEMTVAELEQQFRERYGLNVQVFRKSGKVWLETTVTDNWTLEQQNSQGEALSNLHFTRPTNNGQSGSERL